MMTADLWFSRWVWLNECIRPTVGQINSCKNKLKLNIENLIFINGNFSKKNILSSFFFKSSKWIVRSLWHSVLAKTFTGLEGGALTPCPPCVCPWREVTWSNLPNGQNLHISKLYNLHPCTLFPVCHCKSGIPLYRLRFTCIMLFTQSIL